ncbi:hypothetical protein D922_02759 [Enterococcus faecalis 06-MB-DW-09]|nr:hypothetical protein D922_02759 [Enterococcus faecalis 06-MB-DW-09]
MKEVILLKKFVYENAIKKVYPIIHSMLFHEVPVFQNEKYSLDDLLKDSSLADFEQLYEFAAECLDDLADTIDYPEDEPEEMEKLKKMKLWLTYYSRYLPSKD